MRSEAALQSPSDQRLLYNPLQIRGCFTIPFRSEAALQSPSMEVARSDLDNKNNGKFKRENCNTLPVHDMLKLRHSTKKCPKRLHESPPHPIYKKNKQVGQTLPVFVSKIVLLQLLTLQMPRYLVQALDNKGAWHDLPRSQMSLALEL